MNSEWESLHELQMQYRELKEQAENNANGSGSSAKPAASEDVITINVD